LKEYLKRKVTLFNLYCYVCDVKKEANDNQITYGIKTYPATLLIEKNNTVTIRENIANKIRVTVAKNLLG
jgi:hypothetical protein